MLLILGYMALPMEIWIIIGKCLEPVDLFKLSMCSKFFTSSYIKTESLKIYLITQQKLLVVLTYMRHS